MSDVPVPIASYVSLIKYRRSPYYDIAQHFLRELENHYREAGGGSGVFYSLNPRTFRERIAEKARNSKVTTVNVCRTILAILYGCKLREGEDFYITTTSGGRRNYHIKVDGRTLSLLRSFCNV